MAMKIEQRVADSVVKAGLSIKGQAGPEIEEEHQRHDGAC
jgi:hypothetical protein